MVEGMVYLPNDSRISAFIYYKLVLTRDMACGGTIVPTEQALKPPTAVG